MEVYGYVGHKGAQSGSAERILKLLNGPLPQPVVSLLLTGKPDGIDDSKAAVASFMLFGLLRGFVDMWINTGKAQAGENAHRRTYWREELQDFVDRNPPIVELTKQGPCLVMSPRPWDRQKKLSPFATDFAQGLLRAQPQLERVAVKDRVWLVRTLPFAWDAAIALLLQLLDSPERKRLFRCDGCGDYFMRTRAPKKDVPIYHGSWCAKCKGKGGAKRTEASRTRRTKHMIDAAAEAWAQWKPGTRFGARASWIVRKVNAQRPAGQNPIQVNWVTRHQTEIEAKAKERENAKG